MKKLILAGLVAGALVACNNSDQKANTAGVNATKDAAALTSIQFSDSVQSLGKIEEGQQLRVNFHFTNSGNKPLVIESVRPSCGCTIANYPQDPIAPGKGGEITGVFNSTGREGLQNKSLTVIANTQGSKQHILHFSVEVEKTKG